MSNVRHREHMRATPEQLHEMLTYCLSFARTMLEDSGGEP